jgi:glycosyltransferase involved in cell wall biosynthesis
MRRKVLIVTCELPPLAGLPTRGGGLRVWGLAEGLRAHGHDARISVARAAVPPGFEAPAEIAELLHEPDKLNELILNFRPDVVIAEQWGMATYLGDLKIPLIIDLHGPLSLENAFKESGNFLSDALTKIDALAKADLLICPGEHQRQYFLGWFLMAGASPHLAPIEVVPVGLSPATPAHETPATLKFVFGGVTWPWIDPFPGLETLAKRVAAHDAATLDLYVGAPAMDFNHPLYAVNRDIYRDYRGRLEGLARIAHRGLVPRDELLRAYAAASVAYDLYQPNVERRLAFTTRTVEYLWCGLPVIYGDYGELAAPIREFDAGWVVDPQDEAALNAALDEIFAHPEIVAGKSANAQRLARERLSWDRAAAPLARFVAAPTFREKKPALLAGFRDYFRNESVAQILAAKNQVAELNEALRKAAEQAEADRRERDRRYDDLVQEFKVQRAQNDEHMRRQGELHRQELGRKEDDLRRQQERLDHEVEKRDAEIDRLHRENQAAVAQAYEEIKRLNQELERQRVDHEAQTRAIVERHEAIARELRAEIERQSRTVEALARERDALNAELGGKIAALDRAVTEKEKFVEAAERRLAALQADGETLKRRADLAERRLADFEDDDGLKRKLRFQKRSSRLFFQLPRLAWLFAVNLLANSYMKIRERLGGGKVFPGT